MACFNGAVVYKGCILMNNLVHMSHIEPILLYAKMMLKDDVK